MQQAAHSGGRRLPELDLLRALALAGVVVIHATAWIVPAETSPLNGPAALAIGLARFSVPAFVFASGLALYRSQGARPKDPRAFLTRRWSRTLVPWLVWVPAYLALDLWQGLLAPAHVRDWLLSGGGHLYFLLLVAQLYLVLLFLPRSRRGLYAFAAAATILQLALDAAHAHGPLDGDRWATVQSPFWAGYFALGCLAGAEYERLIRLRRLWPLAALAAVAATALVLAEAAMIGQSYWRQGAYSFLWPSRLPATLAICLAVLWGGAALKRRPAWLFTIAEELGSRSLGVYVLQSAVLVFLGPRTGQLPAAARVALLVPVTLVIAYAATRLLLRFRLGRLSLGERAAAAAKLPGDAERRAYRPKARAA